MNRAALAACLTALSLAVVTPVASAAPAHADQDSYLKVMTDEGFDMTQADMLKAGYMVCNMLYQGYPEQQVVSAGLAQQHQASPREMQLFVSTAQAQLCPDAR